MQEEPIQVISPPSLDIVSYTNNVIEFFTTNFPVVVEVVKSAIGFLIGISIPISVLLFIGIIVSVERLKIIRKKEEEFYNPPVEVAYDKEGKVDPTVANKWKQVLDHIESNNPNDWRQGVIEADIMLGDLLTKMGYRGEGIGEQLKRVEKGDFKTLNDAWEAHKIRNQLAHSGSDYSFTQHDARKTIHMYRKVFEEFFYI